MGERKRYTVANNGERNNGTEMPTAASMWAMLVSDNKNDTGIIINTQKKNRKHHRAKKINIARGPNKSPNLQNKPTGQYPTQIAAHETENACSVTARSAPTAQKHES